MDIAPICRSTSRRTNTASFNPWQRTASLASAAAALTISGIALGYHGFYGYPDLNDAAGGFDHPDGGVSCDGRGGNRGCACADDLRRRG